MCLIALAWRTRPQWPLVLIANRDERHDRLSEKAARWAEAPQVLGGRDLEFGGTWLGVSEQGRLAAVTNYRNRAVSPQSLESRGLLASRFLKGELNLEGLRALDPLAYRPFSLIAVEAEASIYLTNQPPGARGLEPGLHGMSNGPLDDKWPKTRRALAVLSGWLDDGPSDVAPLFRALADETPAPDRELPDTGLGLDLERRVSPCFVKGPVYGTRCSTVIRVDETGRGELIERSFGPDGAPAGESHVDFRWPIG
jgi:uncharacterized protein with NRDE domain